MNEQASTSNESDAPNSPTTHSKALPPLPWKNKSFLSFLTTQALGAFNDNVFKQLVLLLGVGFSVANVEYQALVQFLFALPFLLFSGLAGDLADRYSKARIMLICKIMEIVIALLGTWAFLLMYSSHKPLGGIPFCGIPMHLIFLAAVAFLLGTQSAFFGPPKYGGLPELVRPQDLAPATGMTQMTTFLAIIFGVALAGFLADILMQRMYLAGLLTVGIALAGTITALGIARNPATDPQRRISAKSLYSIIPTLYHILQKDRLLMLIMLIYSWFWFVGGVALTSINSLGKLQLGLNNFETSLMVATTSLGIAVGSVTVGWLSQGKVRLGLIMPALLVLILCLAGVSMLPVYNPTDTDILLFNKLKNSPEMLQSANIIPYASLACRSLAFGLFFLIGVASGFFSVPLLAFIQARPEDSEKGRVFAAVNWLNWVFILTSAIAYGMGMKVLDSQANQLMALLAAITAAIGFLLLPAISKQIKHNKPEFVY